MFGLFKRTKIQPWEVDLLRKTISLLPFEYQHLNKQINDGLFRGVLVGLSDLPGYIAFTYNSGVAKKFENKKDKNHQLTGIKVWDIKSGQYLSYTIYVSTGTINGYSIIGPKKFVVDLNNINTQNFKKNYGDYGDYKKIAVKLNTEEKKAINAAEVYEIVLNGKSYFHVMDLEDGDFIGIDDEKNIYKIRHDPFEIKPIKSSLIDILNNQSN